MISSRTHYIIFIATVIIAAFAPLSFAQPNPVINDGDSIVSQFDSSELKNQTVVTGSIEIFNSQQVEDTTRIDAEKFSPKSLTLPGALMALGIAGAVKDNNSINKTVRDCMDDWRGSHKCRADDYLRFVPSASFVALSFISTIPSKHTTSEKLMLAATSHAIMLACGYGLKTVVNERRPDFSDRKSFPSGHVALSFTGAELLRMEYGNAYGFGGYAIACCVAGLRLYNGKHWLNDVLMGAGIGILSARAAYWLLPLEKKLLGMTNKDKTITLLPSYQHEGQQLTINFTARF